MSLCPLIERLIQEHQELWNQYTRHPFVKALAEGTLPIECYVRYTAQCYLYLRYYAKSQGFAITRVDSFDEMDWFAKCVLATSQSVQRNIDILEAHGVDKPTLDKLPELGVTQRYGQFLINVGKDQDSTILDLSISTAPCLFGYGEIGRQITSSLSRDSSAETLEPDATWVRPKNEGNPYWQFVETFAGAEYHLLIQQASGKDAELLSNRRV